MLEKKQTKNELRSWPDWRTVKCGTPIEHIENDVQKEADRQWKEAKEYFGR
jgi:hypothetical protein